MSEKTLKVLIISDGRAGHVNRSKGVLRALKKKRDVEVNVLELKCPKILPKAMLPRLARKLSAEKFLKWMHGIKADELTKPDVIISAGGKTIGANAALAEVFSVPNIYVGKLRGMPNGSVALAFPPYLLRGEAVQREIMWAPVNVDPDDFSPAQQPISSVGFLIGGDTKPVPFSVEDWKSIAEMVRQVVQKFDVVKLATSPRTPAAAYAAFAGIKGIEYIDFREQGVGSAAKIFGCDAVCATLDSTSMITEAIAVRRPVLALCPAQYSPTADIKLLDADKDAGRLAFVGLGEAADVIAQKLGILKPIEVNHLDVLAEAIFADLPELS